MELGISRGGARPKLEGANTNKRRRRESGREVRSKERGLATYFRVEQSKPLPLASSARSHDLEWFPSASSLLRPGHQDALHLNREFQTLILAMPMKRNP